MQEFIMHEKKPTVRVQRSTTEAYMSDKWQDLDQAHTSSVVDVKKSQVNHSSRIPLWIWRPLAALLGIKRTPTEKPILGTFCYLIMLTTAIAFGVSSVWITVADVLSVKTKTTVFTVTFNCILGLFWCAIGVYANQLAFTVLTSRSMVESIRLHMRTILKINSGLLTSVLVAIMLGLHMYRGYTKRIQPEPDFCELVDLPNWLCYFSYANQVCYAVFGGFWNLVVFIIVMSVLRTVTIILRRFIRELEFDGKVMNKIYFLKNKEEGSNVVWRQDAIDMFTSRICSMSSDSETDDDVGRPAGTRSVRKRRRNQRIRSNVFHFNPEPGTIEQQLQSIAGPSGPSPTVQGQRQDLNHTSDGESAQISASETVSLGQQSTPSQRFVNLENRDASIEEYESLILSLEDFCNRYWKLQRRMTAVSFAFQRWVSSWLFFVCIWTISYIIDWLTKTPTALDIAQFLIPLLVFGLLCSAYGEANNEGTNIMRFMYPSDKRLTMTRHFYQFPLQVGLFNAALTYTTILSVFVALFIAFTSKVVMDELSRSGK